MRNADAQNHISGELPLYIRANLVSSMSQKDVPKMAENLAADSRDSQIIGCCRNGAELWRVDGFVLSNRIQGGRRWCSEKLCNTQGNRKDMVESNGELIANKIIVCIQHGEFW